jgi:hypothetical protein
MTLNNEFMIEATMKRLFAERVLPLSLLALCLVVPLFGTGSQANAQFQYKWMAAGSLHNWYGNTGSEIEEGRIKEQQDGLRWPSFYRWQDIQCAKGLWVGTTNFTDANGKFWAHKVLHVGPRVDGTNDFFPKKFVMTSKFEMPVVYVDGAQSIGERDMVVDNVVPGQLADVMIENDVDLPIGLTMNRKIMQFSQEFHDNYIVSDYTFTNTSNKTLTGVIAFFQYRWAANRAVGYVVGNSSRWGINTMLDTRGDGVKPDPPGQQFRAQYAWHGRYPTFTAYDNIGAPMWSPAISSPTDPADTVGRIGAPQFPGVVTLHADKSPTDTTDDPSQPSTTSWVGSDEPNQSNNDQFNSNKNTSEYTQYMAGGHKSPRHADVVEPTGNFRAPTGDPALGTPGGFSAANGYGPYDLAPGQKVRIVWAEAVAGLSREACFSVGRKYKAGLITKEVKNDSVLSGRDSLFQSFRRALASYAVGYQIPRPPLPPKSFTINSGGDKISLAWEVYGTGPTTTGFRIYRSIGRVDGPFTLLYTAGPSERSYEDRSAVRGDAYYYYLQCVGDPAQNSGAGLTPNTALLSSANWTLTFEPAFLRRQAGNTAGPENMDSIRVVPNPYAVNGKLKFFGTGQEDRVYFFNIPGYCTIRVFTELGELIYEINHANGTGDDSWNLVTSSSQIVVSGIYLVVIDNTHTGERVIKKLSVIR